MEITRDYLMSRLRYDPATGEFFWLAKSGDGRLTNSWNARYAGTKAGHQEADRGYVFINLGNRNYRASRLAWLYMTGRWPEPCVDHANCNRADDRWGNLREATFAENSCNRPGYASSGLKGAYTHASLRGKWFSAINVNGKRIRLGTFDTAEAAHAAYVAASATSHGQFGRAA